MIKIPQSRYTLIATLLIYTTIMTFGLHWIISQFFEIQLESKLWYRDFLGNLAVVALATLLCQTLKRSLILASILVIGFQLTNAGKMVVLGTPMSPDDFIQVRNLFWLWEGWILVATVLMAAIPIIAIIILIRWRSLQTWVTILSITTVTLLIGQYRSESRDWLDQQFGHSVWNQPENFRRRGLSLHLLQESVRTWAKFDQIPNKQQIQALNLKKPTTNTKENDFPARNVHFILLESFFDINSLGKKFVPNDPFPKAFTELWEQTGKSTTLTPVWGGYTANAEFEALCGFPVTENAVFFEGWLRRPSPCLPKLLGQHGYHTIASHPNVAGFWNRTNAYPLIGFETYWDKRHFDLSDSVGGILLDHSLYRQIFKKLEQEKDRPVFNYILTYHGHLPFPSNSSYPENLPAGVNNPLLRGYINHLFYKTRDLMSLIEALKKKDPNSLIVMFGDHLPFLGPNHQTFTDAGKLAPQRDQFSPEMFSYLVRTPLIIIDGEKGPIKTGEVPLYRLPAMVLDLLGIQNKSMLDWTTQPNANQIIRPLPGMHVVKTQEQHLVCRPDQLNDSCQESTTWVNRIKTLSRDVFSGEQYSLQ